MKTAIELISEERKRQIEKEGWSHGHDDLHVSMDLAVAGAAYALNCAGEHTGQDESWKKYYLDGCEQFWPFDTEDFFKPTPDDPIRQLTKAAALIVAEIERLQRAKKPLNEKILNASNIQKIQWDESNLIIYFHNGGVYQYFDVPKELSVWLGDAKSPGAFLNREIKGKYRYTRID